MKPHIRRAQFAGSWFWLCYSSNDCYAADDTPKAAYNGWRALPVVERGLYRHFAHPRLARQMAMEASYG